MPQRILRRRASLSTGRRLPTRCLVVPLTWTLQGRGFKWLARDCYRSLWV